MLYGEDSIAQFAKKFHIPKGTLEIVGHIAEPLAGPSRQVTHVQVAGSDYVFYADDFVAKTIAGVIEDVEHDLPHGSIEPILALSPLEQKYTLLNGEPDFDKPIEKQWHEYQVVDNHMHVFFFKWEVNNEG